VPGLKWSSWSERESQAGHADKTVQAGARRAQSKVVEMILREEKTTPVAAGVA
jgi:hypothetical protein